MGRFELQIIMRSDKDGYLAHGMFDGKGVTVFKGSQISVSEQDKKDIRRLRNIGLDESGKLVEDKYFKSPTAASIFVCGQASNGWDDGLRQKDSLLLRTKISNRMTVFPIQRKSPNLP